MSTEPTEPVAVWALRGDGVEVGVVPFGAGHPSPGLRGRWHVQLRRPGRALLVMSSAVTEAEARAVARHVWATWPIHTQGAGLP